MSWSLRLRRCPHCRKKSRWKNAESLWRTTRHFWSLIYVDIQIIIKGSASSLKQFLGQPSLLQNHLRCHLASFTPTLYIMEPYTPNSTNPTLLIQLYSTQLYSNPTHHPVSVPSQAIPHAIRSRDPCQDVSQPPHRSVGPTTGTHLPEEGGWNRI